MIPDGYARHSRRSPLTDPWEPLYARDTGDAIVLGVEIGPAHCNARGTAHGGLLTALADNAMGLSAVKQAQAHPDSKTTGAVTVTLTVDFIEPARPGDFVAFVSTVLKTGRTLAFVECRVTCGERLVARANATFRML